MDFLHRVDTLPPLLQTLAHSGLWLLLLAVLFVPLERLFPERRAAVFRRGFATDLGYYFVNAVALATLVSVPLSLVALAMQAWMPAGLAHATHDLPVWLRAVLGMTIGEIGFYWGHRWSHEIPLLWRFHAIHHSPEEVDWLVASRQHPLDTVFTRTCGFVPLTVLGLLDPLSADPSMLALAVLIGGQVWAYFVHANVGWRFGVLEWAIASPAFHRWHHTNDGPRAMDRNYAPMLPWIDWIFGTMHLPPHAMPARYGIDGTIPDGLVQQLVQPFLSLTFPAPPKDRG